MLPLLLLVSINMEKESQEGIIPNEIIINKILYIRGIKVMLDSDPAELYNVETKVLNQAVNRNLSRFPKDFMFQLTDLEWSNLKSQFVTSSWGGRRKLPFVFTEHGVLMLSSVLNSKRAVEVNIQVMRIFTHLRSMLQDNSEIRSEIESIKGKLSSNDENMKTIFSYLDQLLDKNLNAEERKHIGYKSFE